MRFFLSFTTIKLWYFLWRSLESNQPYLSINIPIRVPSSSDTSTQTTHKVAVHRIVIHLFNVAKLRRHNCHILNLSGWQDLNLQPRQSKWRILPFEIHPVGWGRDLNPIIWVTIRHSNQLNYPHNNGADNEVRTRDLMFGRHPFYQLNYTRILPSAGSGL